MSDGLVFLARTAKWGERSATLKLAFIAYCNAAGDSGKGVEVDLEDVAEAAECSAKHAMRLRRKLVDLGLLRFATDNTGAPARGGNGRGDRPVFDIDLTRLAALNDGEFTVTEALALNTEDKGDETSPFGDAPAVPERGTTGDPSADIKGDLKGYVKGRIKGDGKGDGNPPYPPIDNNPRNSISPPHTPPTAKSGGGGGGFTTLFAELKAEGCAAHVIDALIAPVVAAGLSVGPDPAGLFRATAKALAQHPSRVLALTADDLIAGPNRRSKITAPKNFIDAVEAVIPRAKLKITREHPAFAAWLAHYAACGMVDTRRFAEAQGVVWEIDHFPPGHRQAETDTGAASQPNGAAA